MPTDLIHLFFTIITLITGIHCTIELIFDAYQIFLSFKVGLNDLQSKLLQTTQSTNLSLICFEQFEHSCIFYWYTNIMV